MGRTVVAAVGLFAGVLAVGGAQPTPSPAPLTGADYVEIETAYGRSLHAVGMDGGSGFSDVFTIDGTIAGPAGRVMGREQLAQYAVSQTGRRHWITNLLIEVSPDGALGWAFVVQARGLEFQAGALYRDRWVRVPEGWRLREREIYPGNQMPPWDHYPAPSNLDAQGFTPRDYFEVKSLLTRYNLGWDNAAMYDVGRLTTFSFTDDVLFERPGGETRQGQEGLIAQAKQYAQSGGTHHWDANLLLDLEAGTVAGLMYDLLLGVPPSGNPVAIRGSRGTLAHRFVRTAGGWLVKYRLYEGTRAVPEVAWPEPGFGVEAAELVAEADSQGVRDGHLSAIDHVAITQLYARSVFAFDSAGEQGGTFARTFTSDGSMTRAGVTAAGTRPLADLAAANTPGLRTWTSNMVLEPTSSGAIGRVYVLTAGPNAEEPVVDVGTFEDELVRTPDGWRFKRRRYRSEIPDATSD